MEVPDNKIALPDSKKKTKSRDGCCCRCCISFGCCCEGDARERRAFGDGAVQKSDATGGGIETHACFISQGLPVEKGVPACGGAALLS